LASILYRIEVIHSKNDWGFKYVKISSYKLLSNFLIKIKRRHLFYELFYNMPPTFYVVWDTENLVLRYKKTWNASDWMRYAFRKECRPWDVTLIDWVIEWVIEWEREIEWLSDWVTKRVSERASEVSRWSERVRGVSRPSRRKL